LLEYAFEAQEARIATAIQRYSFSQSFVNCSGTRFFCAAQGLLNRLFRVSRFGLAGFKKALFG